MNVDTRIEDALQDVLLYAPQINEWKVLKKELMKCLNPEVRKQFSTRDPITKKQNFNHLEKKVAERWQVISGVTLIFT